MARNWTDEQKAAIDARRGTVLVSAAAGSGKTAVLTQRIIESILDADEPVDITDLLVVTYSRAAAAELKSRIAEAVRQKLAENPSDKRLRRQQIGLERAEISTIHSFCLKMIGEGATKLGLPAGLRVADPTESKLLMRQVIDRLLEEEYRKAAPAFMALTDNFVTAGDGRFAEKLLELYTKACAMPEGVGIFALFARQLEATDRNTFLDGAFGRLLQREVAFFAAHYENEYRFALKVLGGDPLYAKTHAAFATEYPFLERLTKPFETFDDLCGYVNAFQTVARLPSVKSADKTPAFEEAIAMRTQFKKDLQKLREHYFGRLLETFGEDTARTAKLVRALAELLERYDRLLTEEKIRKGLLDFADLERYTHKLLVENGRPTDYARSVSARYRQIYIDEYQDVNRIQDEIFSAIAADNRFMVGDIKQSIYAFRGAEPSIFADYRKAFSAEGGEGRLIFLSRNFRCDLPVIELTNEVCRKLFPSRGAEVPYQKEDELAHSKPEDSPRSRPVQITLLPSADADADGAGDPEADYVAGEIDRLIRSEGYRPEEIAILLRSAKSVAPNYEKALAKRGIAISSSIERPFFEEPEVLLALALLGCIDNPRQDVYFAGALMSPVFGFTLNDLLGRFRVRAGECLYERLAEAGEDERITAFLDWLEHCRAQSTRLSSDEMLQLVYRTTSLPAIVGADAKRGKIALHNLNKLYELARGYEQNSFMGLHRFLHFVRDAAESGEAVKSEESTAIGAVRILTVHQSKGLEFPVCFLSETMKGVNLTDSKEQILFDKAMGMAVSLRDDSGFVHYNTLLRKMLAKKLTDSALEEEMRVLYVALTRAKERLYITAKAKDPDKVLAECKKLGRNYSAFAIEKHSDYFHWIVGALEEKSEQYRLILPEESACALEESPLPPEPIGEVAEEIPDQQPRDLLDRLVHRMQFEYPAGRLKDLPAKLTVSALKPDLLDEGDGSLSEPSKMVEKPSFLQEKDELQPMGAERGTATHIFMQFCDFDAVEQKGITSELARLTDRGFMSAAMADAVYKEALEAFFTSPLYREMLSASLLKREFRFNVRLPATAFSQDAEYVEALGDTRLLVQGVIDCFFEKSDGTLKLIDYKTDRIGRSPDETAALLLERYGNQLRYYRMALEELTGQTVSEVVLYSFWQSREFSYPQILTVNSNDINGL